MAYSQLNEMIKNSSSPLKSQLEVLCEVIELLGEKLKENYEAYKDAPLSITVIKRDGEPVYRSNPFVEEYRATLRDYHNALGKLEDLTKSKLQQTELKSLDDIRNKFKIAT